MKNVSMETRMAAGKELAAAFARPAVREIGRRAPKKKPRLTAEDMGFYRGVAVAVTILSVFDEPVVAREIVKACGSLRDFRDAGVDEYDLKHVRAAFKGETWRPNRPPVPPKLKATGAQP